MPISNDSDSAEALRTYCRSILNAFDDMAALEQITGAQWFALRRLASREPQLIGVVAAKLCYDAGAMSRLMEQLVQRSLICRERSSADRRVVEVTLSDAGIQIVNRLEQRLKAFLEHQASAPFTCPPLSLPDETGR